jgi:hypothetical protein
MAMSEAQAGTSYQADLAFQRADADQVEGELCCCCCAPCPGGVEKQKPADEEGGGADRYAEGAEGVKRKESFLLSALYAINAVNESVPSLPDCIGNPLRHWTVPATRQLG